MTATITIPIDAETRNRLTSISKQRECSESQLAAEALRQFLDLQAWQLNAIKQGIKAADEGRLIRHEDMRNKWESKLGNQVD